MLEPTAPSLTQNARPSRAATEERGRKRESDSDSESDASLPKFIRSNQSIDSRRSAASIGSKTVDSTSAAELRRMTVADVKQSLNAIVERYHALAKQTPKPCKGFDDIYEKLNCAPFIGFVDMNADETDYENPGDKAAVRQVRSTANEYSLRALHASINEYPENESDYQHSLGKLTAIKERQHNLDDPVFSEKDLTDTADAVHHNFAMHLYKTGHCDRARTINALVRTKDPVLTKDITNACTIVDMKRDLDEILNSDDQFKSEQAHLDHLLQMVDELEAQQGKLHAALYNCDDIRKDLYGNFPNIKPGAATLPDKTRPKPQPK